jgi:hypothetical protein
MRAPYRAGQRRRRLDDSALPLPFPPSRAGGPYPYVIVTTRDLQLEFLRLANAHTARWPARRRVVDRIDSRGVPGGPRRC